MNKAVFYDRDGTILEMVYDEEHGTIDTLRKKEDIRFVPGIVELLKHTSSLGYLNIIISNQPGVGLKKITKKQNEDITREFTRQIEELGGKIDGLYYCYHHPFALLTEYRKKCNCRKPAIGLFKNAIKDFGIDPKKSWVIGDGVNDILAGDKLKCKTILLANIGESEYFRILESKLGKAKSTHIAKRLDEAMDLIKK